MKKISSFVDGLNGLRLSPESDNYAAMTSFVRDIGKAEKLFLHQAAIDLLNSRPFSSISAVDLARYLFSRPLPFPKGKDLLWIETPISADKMALLLLKRGANGKSFSVRTASMYAPNTDEGKRIRAKTNRRQTNPVFPCVYCNPKADFYFFATGCSAETQLRKQENTDNMYYVTYLPNQETAESALNPALFEVDQAMINNATAAIQAESKKAAMLALQLLTLMAHEKSWNQARSKKQDHSRNPNYPFPLALSNNYLNELRQKAAQDKLRTFINIPASPTPLFSNIVQSPLLYTTNDDVPPVFTLTTPIAQKTDKAVHIRYDRRVYDLTRRVMNELPTKTVISLLLHAGTPFKKLWVEGDFGLAAHMATQTVTPKSIGALVQKEEAGYEADIILLSLNTGTAETVITTFHGSLHPSSLGKNQPASVVQGAVEGGVFKDDAVHFISTLLLLSRARTELASDAGLADKDSFCRVLDPDDLFKHPFIRSAAVNPTPTRIDVTKPRARVIHVGRKSLDTKSQEWEDAKIALRAKYADLLTPDNFFAVNRDVATVAKEMFGNNVTARATRVRKSKPIPKRVNKDEPDYTRAEHVRIDLFYESNDPVDKSIRNAAYQLVATTPQPTSIKSDERGVLILTVPSEAAPAP